MRLVQLVTNPRFDEVYRDGLSWLDGLGGEALTASEVDAKFAEARNLLLRAQALLAELPSKEG